MRFNWLFAAIVAILVAASACGSLNAGAPEADENLSVRETAQRLISNDVAASIGLGTLDPVCEEVAQPFHGREFRCSATSDDSRNVYFLGTIEQDGRVALESSNILLASDIPEIEAVAIGYVNQQLGTVYRVESFSCGSESIILNPERVFSCAFTEPSSGDVFDAEVRLEDPATNSVTVTIASEAR